MKKILNIVLISIVLVTFILPSTHSCAIEEAFFEISELEVSKNDKIEMIINLNQIKYNKFLFELKASEDIENVEIGGNEITDNTDKITDAGLEVEKSGNEISIEVNKETNNLDSLILYYQVPQNLNVNDKIKFVATIANLDSNETESDTQTVEIDKKQNGNNEQNNVKQNENVGNPQGTEQNNIEKNTDQSLNKEFSKENSTYFITVEKDVSSLEIIANADDEASSVCIYGNEEIADGTSKILISVTAENGNVRNYRIYVTKNS